MNFVKIDAFGEDFYSSCEKVAEGSYCTGLGVGVE